MQSVLKFLAIAVLVGLLDSASVLPASPRFKAGSENRSPLITNPMVPLSPAVGSVAVTGQTAGPNPFIVNLQLAANPPNELQSVKFTIVPKPGSVTRPISATYFSDYLQSRGYFNLQTGAITLPVFGLY